jgi:hypothetical protein
MNVFETIRHYTPQKPSVKEAVDAKMKVLREFYIVDKTNEFEIRTMLHGAIQAQPNKDYELVLDRVAHKLIEEKLNS